MANPKHIPPKLATRLLHKFLRTDFVEEVEGDLAERFYVNLKSGSPLRSKANYWYEVVNYLRPFALRKSNSNSINSWDMFENYFKIARRSLIKQKLYSVINIGGLTLGLACFILIALYVQHEFSYDQFYPNAERIHRVYQKQEGNVFMGTDFFALTPAKLASVMIEECPEVEHATCTQRTSGLLTIDDNNFWQEGIAADSKFFQVFNVHFQSGNPAKALDDAKSIVLTETLAKTIFGNDNPLGRAFRYQNSEVDYTVTAVIADPPVNSSIKYSFIINLMYNDGYVEEMKRTGWNNNSYYTYFLLRSGTNIATLESSFKPLLKKYQIAEDYKDYPFKDQYFAQPLTESYFQSGVNFEMGQKGNMKVIYIYSAVALIVLILACVNYMNLAIARSVKRAREVGLRKVVGAFRKQLIGQFLSESIVIAFLSLVMAVALMYLLLPYFGRMVERPIHFDVIANPWLLPGLLILMLLVGFLAGTYPALVVSSMNPIDALKTKSDPRISGFRLQRFLVVFQFSVSVTLIIGSLVINQQLSFISTKDLGYDKEDVVTILLKDRSLITKFTTLSHEFSQHPNVIASTLSTHLPAEISSSTLIRKTPEDADRMAIYQCAMEYSFMDVFGTKLIAGRNFSPEMKNDSEESLILNETAVRDLGWTPEEAIGKQVDYGGPKNIIGVIRDFHMLSMHLQIQPLMIRLADNRGKFISLKIKPEDKPQTLAFIEAVFKKNSIYPFEYRFLSDTYDDLYSSELRLGEVFGFFTILSIVIATLGLFGLAAFTVGQRTKEIGIRKILGASVKNLSFLLTKDFLILVAIAFVVAVPISWYTMNQWLQGFAYRIDISWSLFAIAGILAVLIANMAIGYQSIKAAMANPVDSLKAE